MKNFRKLLLVVLSVLCCSFFAFGLTACNNDNSSTNNQENKDILAVYNMYVAYAEENNTTPLSYEDWLLSIKGEKGDKGDTGEQGIQGTPITQTTTITASETAIFTTMYSEGLKTIITGLTDYGKTLTTIIIPTDIDGSEIGYINNEAFIRCKNVNVVIENTSLIGLGLDSFGYFGLYNSTITFVGTMDQWKKIKGTAKIFCSYSDSDNIKYSVKVKCSDGEV